MITPEEKTQIEERIVDVLKTVYDPEIPVDIWNLGMIYKIDVKDDASVDVDMTFTAPSCPAADFILEDVRTKIESVEGVKSVVVNGRRQIGGCQPRLRTHLGPKHDVGRSPGGAGIRLSDK